jgi:peptidoglycan L-alanyl-D-glutamate endopeptidase CwlK
MPRFGTRSLAALNTCIPEIISLAKEAITVVDFSVLVGHRTVAEQNRLYAIGRTTPGRIVTYKKGGESHHNELPSPALDFAPWPIDWEDLARFGEVAGVMKYIAWMKGIEMIWGGDWTTLKDYPHIQVVTNE